MTTLAKSRACLFAAVLLPALLIAAPAPAVRILFIGNSFTFAFGSPVRFYRPDSVTDLNSEGQGGVPALFKSFSTQAGLHYDVALETHPGVSLDWHWQHKRVLLEGRPWDQVVMQEYSTLDEHHPGDPAALVATVPKLTEMLRGRNAAVQVRLLSTWPRADQTYLPQGAWYGKPIETMAEDLRAGNLRAAAAPGVVGIIPVGSAWVRAMHEKVADPNPYDGIDAGQLNLWTYDGYHASVYGYYLEALMVFGAVTSRDPRTLSANECAGYELGLSGAQVMALENIAYEQLSADHLVPAATPPAAGSGAPQRCASGN